MVGMDPSRCSPFFWSSDDGSQYDSNSQNAHIELVRIHDNSSFQYSTILSNFFFSCLGQPLENRFLATAKKFGTRAIVPHSAWSLLDIIAVR